jgi:murein DD-endopeptidase MepM/ murein hydrolase activator NlpD
MKKYWWLGSLVVGIVAVGVIAAVVWRYQGRAASPGIAPTPLPVSETAALADTFDFPLDPARFGALIPGQSGLPLVDTRFGAQNPALGNAGKCFVSLAGEHIPFSQLYHAGEDWLALNKRGRVSLGKAAGEPVHAVANGVVEAVTLMGFDGYVIIVAHALPEGEEVWSVYWHVAAVRVAAGEAVTLGQALAVIHDRGLNSHLHWEMRTFADGSALFPLDSAGGRGTCNGHSTGVGYTWDDDPVRALPEAWGYLNPTDFVEEFPCGIPHQR